MGDKKVGGEVRDQEGDEKIVSEKRKERMSVVEYSIPWWDPVVCTEHLCICV